MFFCRVLIMYDYVQCLIHSGCLLNCLWKLFPWIGICDNTFNIPFSALHDCHNITHILREIFTSQVSPNADIALPNICNAFVLNAALIIMNVLSHKFYIFHHTSLQCMAEPSGLSFSLFSDIQSMAESSQEIPVPPAIRTTI